MAFIDDPEAEKRSLMAAQKPICTGAATGRRCKHYVAVVVRVESANPDNLRLGERMHACLLPGPGDFWEWGGERGIPVKCSGYKPYPKPLLPWREDVGVYDAELTEYKPLDPVQIQRLQAGRKPGLAPAKAAFDGNAAGVAKMRMELEDSIRKQLSAGDKRISIDEAFTALGAPDAPRPTE